MIDSWGFSTSIRTYCTKLLLPFHLLPLRTPLQRVVVFCFFIHPESVAWTQKWFTAEKNIILAYRTVDGQSFAVTFPSTSA